MFRGVQLERPLSSTELRQADDADDDDNNDVGLLLSLFPSFQLL